MYVFDMISKLVRDIRERHPDRGVIVNPDVSMTPESQREKFLATPQKLAQVGHTVIPFVLPDGYSVFDLTRTPQRSAPVIRSET
jgi:hypothetical protein